LANSRTLPPSLATAPNFGERREPGLRIETVEVEAQRRVEHESSIEQGDVVAQEHAAERIVGFRERAGGEGLTGRRLDTVTNALLVGPADVAAKCQAMGDGARIERCACLAGHTPNAILERV
jgi:hypothetical protein